MISLRATGRARRQNRELLRVNLSAQASELPARCRSCLEQEMQMSVMATRLGWSICREVEIVPEKMSMLGSETEKAWAWVAAE